MNRSSDRCTKIFVWLFALTTLFGASRSTGAQEIALHSKAAVLMDYHTGEILYAHNEHTPLPPASVTKVMTLLLALEAVQEGRASLDDLVVTSEYAASMGGTQIWLEPGERMPLEEMLYAIAVGSANDAAVAVAEHIGGTEQAFVDMMNEKAKELGMQNTQFANPSGLPPQTVGKSGPHVSSAYDIALMSRYAISLPGFLEYTSTWGPVVMRPETLQKPVLWSYNRLMRSYPGMDGIKTGMTSEAGYCLAATAERDGLRLIAVTLGARTSAERDADIRRLLDYGFIRLKAVVVAKEGDVITEVETIKGKEPSLRLVAGADLPVSMPRESTAEPETEIVLTRRPVAPILEGEVMGHLIVRLDGEERGRVPLVAETTVEKASVFALIGRYFLNIVRVP
ncbi:MAG TPA: D-alanyl-D-alanine carboxypeptidase family protein [Limnochordia bacterium]|nr:D-alanyl-D-alanine carboxypeptidase family protein [Limnochordia bacterium]